MAENVVGLDRGQSYKDFSSATLAVAGAVSGSNVTRVGNYMFVPTPTVKSSVVTLGNATYAGQYARFAIGPTNDAAASLTVKTGNNDRLFDLTLDANAAPTQAKGLVNDKGDFGQWVEVQATDNAGNWAVTSRSSGWKRVA